MNEGKTGPKKVFVVDDRHNLSEKLSEGIAKAGVDAVIIPVEESPMGLRKRNNVGPLAALLVAGLPEDKGPLVVVPDEKTETENFIKAMENLPSCEPVFLPESEPTFTPPHVKRPRSHVTSAMAAMMGLAGMAPEYREPKPMRKCLLKGCEKMHNHNGGYCCAEHCKQDAQELRDYNRLAKAMKKSVKRISP